MRRDKKVIPIVDCPSCGAKDVPLSFEGEFTKKGRPDVVVYTCSNCNKVPNVAEDLKVKRYISIKELEELGWKQDKGGKQ